MLIPLCVCFINYDDMFKINKKSKREKYSTTTTIDQVTRDTTLDLYKTKR